MNKTNEQSSKRTNPYNFGQLIGTIKLVKQPYTRKSKNGMEYTITEMTLEVSAHNGPQNIVVKLFDCDFTDKLICGKLVQCMYHVNSFPYETKKGIVPFINIIVDNVNFLNE